MSPVYLRIGIEGYRVLRVEQEPSLRVIVTPKKRVVSCCKCGSKGISSKGRYRRRVRHIQSFDRESELVVECQRYKCKSCSKTFIPQLPGILPGRHSSEPMRRKIYEQHHEGICGKSLATIHKIGSATVERIYGQFTEIKAKERLSSLCPRILGIDEHTLHKRKRFATTFCDLKNRRVFDIVQGKSSADLDDYVCQLKGREKVFVVCIDLSSPYRHLIRKWFPNAKIVADRFHAIRIVIYHFMQLVAQIAPWIKNQSGYLNAFRRNTEKLTPLDNQRLKLLFNRSPALKPIYDQMHLLRRLLNKKHQTVKNFKRLSPFLFKTIDKLNQSTFAPMLTLAKTLSNWAPELAAMWRFTRNNGITEGFHRKMKLIQRRAYGFRNFNNYRLRVIAQCG